VTRKLFQTEASTNPVEDKKFDASYTFRLRRHQGGSFSGLWELTRLRDNPKAEVVKMIEDANALNYTMENLMGELETDGF
jgi:hypothetical protein